MSIATGIRDILKVWLSLHLHHSFFDNRRVVKTPRNSQKNVRDLVYANLIRHCACKEAALLLTNANGRYCQELFRLFEPEPFYHLNTNLEKIEEWNKKKRNPQFLFRKIREMETVQQAFGKDPQLKKKFDEWAEILRNVLDKQIPPETKVSFLLFFFLSFSKMIVLDD